MLLVTGAAGFIGSNVVAALNDAGHGDIVVNDHFAATASGATLPSGGLPTSFRPANCWLGSPVASSTP